MNLAIPLPYVALMLVTFGLLCYVIGASHISNWLMGDHQRLDAAVRLLYSSVGYVYPDDESEPRKPWWRRLSDRMQPVVDAEAVKEGAPVESEESPAEVSGAGSVTTSGQQASGDVGAAPPPVTTSDPEPEPDWRTDIGPIVMPEPTGPQTVPAAAVIDADWETRSAAMLAEARAAIDAIGGGR